MRRVLMKQIKKILKLKYQMDFSYRRIAKSLGVSRSAAAEYCRRFEILPDKLEDFLLHDEDIMYKMLFPEQTILHRQSLRPKPDVEYIDKEIRKKGVTYLLLWQEYKEQNPDGYGYTQFKTYYHKYKKKLNPSMRQIHLNGEKLFVDYSGVTIPIYNSKTGVISKAQIFVAVLGASGYTYVDATPSQKQEYFIKSHTKAFNFFGGVPKILVPDNLKSAVISNNKDGIVLNESYKAMANHYGCVIEPARPYKPKDKAKAEQGVQAIQRWILAVLRHRKFFDVEELNDAISPLLDIYNAKVMKRLNRYSTSTVEIYHKSKLIATHPRYYDSEYSTIKEHQPENHQYQDAKFNPGRYLNWAKSIGVQTVEFTKMKLEQEQFPSYAYRKLNAILSLAKQYEKYEVDLALGYAMSINATTVASIKSILSKKLYYKKPANNIINIAQNNYSNIRGNTEYK